MALAAPRFFAWLIDVALFALVVVLLVQLDGLIFGGELGLKESYQSEQRLIEETEETLDSGVLRSVKTYEEIRTYPNGATATWLKIVERRVGEYNDGDPWDVELTRYEFVEGDEDRPGRYGFFTLAFLVMLPLPYRYFLESSTWQGSVGMRVFGLKVTNWELERPSQGEVLKRNLWRFISVATVGIGYLMALFTKNKQTLHDKLAGTLVVSSKDLAELARG